MKRANPLAGDSSSEEDSSTHQTKRPKKTLVIPLQPTDPALLAASPTIIPLKPGRLKLNPCTEKKLFKDDMSSRPEVSSLQDYDEVPVEDFGEAMLRGMGWSKGKALGRNQSGLKEVVEMKPRARLLGLGATPFTLDAKVKKDSTVKAVSEAAKPSASVTRESSANNGKRIRWLTSQTRIRYLCTEPPRKLVVVDVHSTCCTLQDQSTGRIYEDVVERDCETILPGEGGCVIVVRGKDKGRVGRVVRKERRREVVGVELDVGGVLELGYDDCCEYIGEGDE